MDYVPRRQEEPRRDARLAGRTAHTFGNLGKRETGLIEPESRGRVDRLVEAAAAEHALVRCVDDCVGEDLGQVALHDREQPSAAQIEYFHGVRSYAPWDRGVSGAGYGRRFTLMRRA